MRKTIVFLAVFALAASLWAADPFVGNWKLNPAKGKVTGPGSANKSGTATIEAQENGYKLVYDVVNGEGRAVHGEYAPRFDGKDYPVKGNPDVDAVSLRRIDNYTEDRLYKKAGKEVASEHVVISKDGKTGTLTCKGKNAKGQDYTDVAVWEKQ
jgi:hypothetical protein